MYNVLAVLIYIFVCTDVSFQGNNINRCVCEKSNKDWTLTEADTRLWDLRMFQKHLWARKSTSSWNLTDQ